MFLLSPNPYGRVQPQGLGGGSEGALSLWGPPGQHGTEGQTDTGTSRGLLPPSLEALNRGAGDGPVPRYLLSVPSQPPLVLLPGPFCLVSPQNVPFLPAGGESPLHLAGAWSSFAISLELGGSNPPFPSSLFTENQCPGPKQCCGVGKCSVPRVLEAKPCKCAPPLCPPPPYPAQPLTAPNWP